MPEQPETILQKSLGFVQRTFQALRHRNYRLFFFGQIVSLIGTWLQNTALSWLVYSITRDSRTLGLISFAGSIPILFLSVYAGTIADEYSKRRILIITQLASGVLALLLALLVWNGYSMIWLIAVINLLLGVANAFDLPTRQAFVVEMVGKQEVSNAVALNSATFNGARLLGPAIAAALIAFFSIPLCFFLNGISYIAPIIGLSRMRIKNEIKKVTYGGLNRVSRSRAMKDGVDFLNSIPQLRALMVLVVAMTLFGWAYTVNLPVVAAETLGGGSTTYASLLSANGAGALIAALTQAAFANTLVPRTMVFLSIGVFILASIIVAFTSVKVVAMVALVCCGWAIITFFITANTTLQRNTPDAMRGRIMGIYSLSFAGLFPFGTLLAGFVAHQWSVTVALTLNATLLLVIAIPVYVAVRKLPRLSLETKAEVEHVLVLSERAALEAEQIARS